MPCPTADTADAADAQPSCTDVEVEMVLARTAPGADRRAVAERLGDADMVPIPPPSIVDRFHEIGPVPWYLAAMLATLGAAGLIHSSLVTGRRRAHELAVTRALGFTPRQAAAAVRWQGLATAAAGLVIGLVAGVLVGRVVWQNLAYTIAVVVAVRLPAWAPLRRGCGDHRRRLGGDGVAVRPGPDAPARQNSSAPSEPTERSKPPRGRRRQLLGVGHERNGLRGANRPASHAVGFVRPSVVSYASVNARHPSGRWPRFVRSGGR